MHNTKWIFSDQHSLVPISNAAVFFFLRHRKPNKLRSFHCFMFHKKKKNDSEFKQIIRPRKNASEKKNAFALKNILNKSSIIPVFNPIISHKAEITKQKT